MSRDTYQWGRGFELGTILLTKDSRNAQSNPTLASGDVQISKDGGAFANLATLPSVSPASNVRVKVVLSDAECQAKEIMLRFKDTSGDEWDEQTLILSAQDPREGMVQVKIPSGLGERSSITSEQITRSGYPSYGVLFTSSTVSSKTDFDPLTLNGALIYGEDTGTGLIILGGYFYDDTLDGVHNVFGICKDYDKFGITEGGSATISTLWSASSEDTHGSGWTFVVVDSDQSIPLSYQKLFIYIRPSAIPEVAFSRTLDLSRIEAINPNGSAVKASSTGADGHGIEASGNGAGNGMDLSSGATGIGLVASGADGAKFNASSGSGIRAVGSGNTDAGIKAENSGPAIWGQSSSSHGAYLQAGGIGIGLKVISDEGTALLVTSNGKGVVVESPNDDAIVAESGNGAGLKLSGSAGENDLEAKEVGTPIDLGDGASLAENMTSLAGKTTNAAGYDRTTDSQEAIRDRGDLDWEGGDATEAKQDQIIDTLGNPADMDMSTDIANVQSDVDTIASGIVQILSDVGSVYNKCVDIYSDTQQLLVDSQSILDALGSPISLDGGVATLAGMLTKLADDADGASYDATTDSQEAIATRLGQTLSLTSEIDGVSLNLALQIILAMANGRFALNVPTAGQVTFYKRDNSTILFVMESSASGRIRILGA